MESKFYSIFGTGIEIKSDSQKIFAPADSLINFFAEKKKIKNPKITFTLSASRNILGKRINETLRGKPLFRFAEMFCYKKDDCYFFSDGKSLVFSQPEKGIAKGYISERTLKFTRFFSHIFFYIILAELLRYNGFYYIHSSGVEKKGISILIPGNGGVGKTTLSIALVRKGFSYLSDDALLLKKIRNKIIAHSIPGDFHIDPAISKKFKELSAVEKALKYGKGPKRSFDLADFYPDRLILKSKPNIIIFPRIVKEPESTMVHLSSAQCLAKLIPNSLLVMLDKNIAKYHIEALKTLSIQCKPFLLLSGKDMILNPDKVIKNILEKIGKK